MKDKGGLCGLMSKTSFRPFEGSPIGGGCREEVENMRGEGLVVTIGGL